jgi:copper(I)-binding protein
MKRVTILILIAVFLLSACETETGIRVHDAWILPTPQGENAAVYFVLHNHTDQDDELIGAATNVADVVELHRSTSEPGTDVIRMEMVSSVEVAADEEIIFAPGKSHLMLVNLKKELKIGDHVGVILHFRNHEDIVVNVSVQDAAPEDEHTH